MPPALIGIVGAAIGAVGSVVSSHNTSKAIDKSTDASLQAQRESLAAQTAAVDKQIAAQTDALNKSLGFQTDTFNSVGQQQTDVRNQNVKTLNPFLQTGYSAMNGINALVGLPEQKAYSPTDVKFTPVANPAAITTPANNVTPTSAPVAIPPGYNPAQNTASQTFYMGQPIPAYAYGTPSMGHNGGPALVGENGPEVVNLPQGSHVLPNAFGNALARRQQRQQTAQTPAITQPAATAEATPQQSAFQNFYNSDLYQFPLQQGLDAINSDYAARGMLQSGAAMKAIEQYGSGVAGGALNDYIQILNNQQGLGYSAGTALAGVQSNYSSALGSLGSAYGNNASTLYGNYGNALTNAYGALAGAQSNYANNVGDINSNAINAHATNSNALIGNLSNSLNFGLGNAYSPYASGQGIF